MPRFQGAAAAVGGLELVRDSISLNFALGRLCVSALRNAGVDVIRGVGQSSRMEGPFTIAQLAVDAVGLLDALEIGSAHVLGVSMGGMVAQELALSHPELVSTLTLGCTYCGGDGSSRASPEVARRLAEGSRSGDRERAVRAYWDANVSVGFPEDANAYAAYRANALNRRVAIAVIAAQLQAIAAHETLTRLHRLMMPTLILHGTADQVIPAGNAHLIAAQIPGSRLEIFDGVGHLFFLERPERSAELVRQHATIPG
jgi:3-oxoadipate enol-lactonase